MDAVGRVRELRRLGASAELVVEVPEALERYLVEKGSVAVDGVSLTVAALGERAFTVALIPYTLEETSLRDLGPGDPVNLEADVIAKYVERLLVETGGLIEARSAMPAMPFCTIPEAIEDIRAGRMLVVVDDEDRENEGDLTIAAEKVTPEAINFMARHGRGLICLPMTGERLDALRIPLMVQDDENSAKFGTAFCVPIEAKKGTTTGISAADRARTVLAAVDPDDPARRPGPARPHVPAAGGAGRRAPALRADRGRGGPGPPRRPHRRASSARS